MWFCRNSGLRYVARQDGSGGSAIDSNPTEIYVLPTALREVVKTVRRDRDKHRDRLITYFPKDGTRKLDIFALDLRRLRERAAEHSDATDHASKLLDYARKLLDFDCVLYEVDMVAPPLGDRPADRDAAIQAELDTYGATLSNRVASEMLRHEHRMQALGYTAAYTTTHIIKERLAHCGYDTAYAAVRWALENPSHPQRMFDALKRAKYVLDAVHDVRCVANLMRIFDALGGRQQFKVQRVG